MRCRLRMGAGYWRCFCQLQCVLIGKCTSSIDIEKAVLLTKPGDQPENHASTCDDCRCLIQSEIIGCIIELLKSKSYGMYLCLCSGTCTVSCPSRTTIGRSSSGLATALIDSSSSPLVHTSSTPAQTSRTTSPAQVSTHQIPAPSPPSSPPSTHRSS